MSERWLPIPGFENYEVSDQGNVRKKALAEYVPTHQVDWGDGYPAVDLRRDGLKYRHKVHRLVCLAFVGPSELWVRHLDGNPRNNSLSNLRYGTVSENNYDAVRHGTHINARKTHCPQGHPYSEENTYVFRRRATRYERVCKVCHKARVAAAKAKAKARRASA